jgi:hypothetical protein
MKFKVFEPEPAPLPEVEITLNGEEARVLTAVLGKISGYHNTIDSPRTFLSQLYKKLDENGYTTRPLGNQFHYKGKKFKFQSGMRLDLL